MPRSGSSDPPPAMRRVSATMPFLAAAVWSCSLFSVGDICYNRQERRLRCSGPRNSSSHGGGRYPRGTTATSPCLERAGCLRTYRPRQEPSFAVCRTARVPLFLQTIEGACGAAWFGDRPRRAARLSSDHQPTACGVFDVLVKAPMGRVSQVGGWLRISRRCGGFRRSASSLRNGFEKDRMMNGNRADAGKRTVPAGASASADR
jgi:hypothetical protein